MKIKLLKLALKEYFDFWNVIIFSIVVISTLLLAFKTDVHTLTIIGATVYYTSVIAGIRDNYIYYESEEEDSEAVKNFYNKQFQEYEYLRN